MNNSRLKLYPIPRLTKLKKREQENLKTYLRYIEKYKMRYVLKIQEEANNKISVSILEYIYGVSEFYEQSDITIERLSVQEFLKYDPVIINALVMDPIDFFLKELYNLDERELNVIKSRSLKQTLQTIGDEYEVTCERVRQIEKLVFNKLSKVLGDIFIHYANLEGYIDLNDLSEKINEVELKILNYLYDYHDLFHPDEISGKIIIKTKNYMFLEENIKELAYKNMIYPKDIEFFIEEQRNLGITHLEVEDIETYLATRKLKRVEEGWVNMRLVATPYLYVIKKYFREGIELKQQRTSPDYERMSQFVYDIFGVEKRKNVRSIFMRLRENLVAIDQSIYKLTDDFEFDVIVIDEILENLQSSTDRNVYYFTEIFNKYEKELKSAGIYNRYSLASAVNRTTYKDNADRDKITFSGAKLTSFYQLLDKYVLDTKSPVTVKDIRNEFPYLAPEMVYHNLFSNENIINWGHGIHIHINNVPEASKFNVIEVDQILNEQPYMAYADFVLKFSNSNNLREYGITRESDINELFNARFSGKYIYEDGFIWNKESYLPNKVDRLLLYLNKDKSTEITINEVYNFASNNNLIYDRTRSLVRAVESNFIRKSEKEYYPYETILKCDSRRNLILEIKEIINKEKLVTAEKILQECYLPTDDFLWSKETVVNFIRNKMKEEFNFHPIGVDKLLTTYGLVSTKEYDNLVDLIFDYFKEMGLERVSESEFENFLTDNKISNLGIPIEFYQNEKYIFKNGYFYLT